MTEQQNSSSSPRNEGQPQRKRRKKKKVSVGKVLGTLLLVFLCTTALLCCFAGIYISTTILPNAGLDLGDMSLNLTSTMYYLDQDTGEQKEYLTISSSENRIWVPYAEIPEDLIQATVAVEDKRFYDHHGVDWIRTVKGVLNMFTGGTIQGGSTITQQLIKNVTGWKDVTVKRKITEIFTALEFDKNYSKEETLEWYLNYIYLGERCYGVYTASYMYFGKHVSQLSLAQCASLIGITNNPSIYDPYLSGTDEDGNFDDAWGKKNNAKRAKLVLWNMLDQKYIDQKEYDDACTEVDALVFQRGDSSETVNDVVYNWYQDQVINDVVVDLVATYGWSETLATNKLYSGGLSIITNVDPAAQAIVDDVYSNADNLPYISNSGQQMQAGIVLVDGDGRVVALSGGIGKKERSRIWSRASRSKRPPGSSIKPLSVYAPALEMGLITPNTVFDDVPYSVIGNNAWPVNAYGYFAGRTTVQNAIKVSSNTIAVSVLGELLTPEASFDFLENKYHISSLVRSEMIRGQEYSDINLASLALGGLTYGTSLYEMAAAYAAFPNMGRYVKPSTYLTVSDSSGKILLDNTDNSEYILKESTAYQMNQMLKTVMESGGGTGTAARFSGMTMAGKTGTTSNKKDRWFVGYTPYYTAAVWTGYDRQERMGNSGNPPAALWKMVMSRIHEGMENKDFTKPTDMNLVSKSYCLDSGKLATAACAADVRGSRSATGQYNQDAVPTEACDFHQAVEICTADPILNGDGQSSGIYHSAGDFCPADTVKTVALLDFDRQRVTSGVVARDDAYLLSRWEGQGGTQVCRVHGAPTVADPFDPEKPDTWPTGDPDFNIDDPTTWPDYEPPTPTPTPSPDPDAPPGGIPIESTPPPVVTAPPEGREEEPFVPANSEQ